MAMKWIPISEQLPPDGRWVLARVTRNNWKDPEDQDGVCYKVLKIHHGISLKTRQEMRDGLIKDPLEPFLDGRGNVGHCKRSQTWRQADEGCGNNERAYSFEEFGPGTYFGQEVDFWCEIERL